MNVTKRIVQVEQNRRIRISKKAIFTNGIFLFNIKSQDVKTISYKTEKEGRVIMDYRKIAQEILGYVGGSKNIVSAAHCATRLRLVRWSERSI